jgi:SAM-dependent methyltransferase
VQANGLALPYATGSFDFVYCHYLILWLTDPLAVLREMRRVTRPGGAVLALAEPDYTARIDWPSELSILGPLQASALARQGANPAAGRTLAALFHAAGLRQVSTGLLGGQWGTAPDAGFIASEWNTLRADLGGALPDGTMDHLRQVDTQAWQIGERILFVPTFYASGLG